MEYNTQDWPVTALLTTLVVLLSAILIALVAGLVTYLRRLNAAVSEIAQTQKTLRERVMPLSDDARQLIADTSGLVRSAREEVDRLIRITESLERLIEGKTVADAAGKAIASSRLVLVSLLEGLKQGLKTLRRSEAKPKEEPTDEQQ